MKKLFFFPTIFWCYTGLAQRDHFFVSVVPGIGVVGPMHSLKDQMQQQNFTSTGPCFFSDCSAINYPSAQKIPVILITTGIKIRPYRSIYITAGVSDAGIVTGLKDGSGVDNWFLNYAKVHYSIYQLGGGVQFSFANSRAKLVAGPSVFLVKCAADVSAGLTGSTVIRSTIPGLSLSARLPMGKERKLFGVDFFTELNLAPSAHMDVTVGDDQHKFRVGSINMIHAMIGLALSFRN